MRTRCRSLRPCRMSLVARGERDQVREALHGDASGRRGRARRAASRKHRGWAWLLHDGLGLLAQVERQVVEGADRLAGRARALPAAEGLVAGPGAGRRPLRPVHVGDAGLDVVEERGAPPRRCRSSRRSGRGAVVGPRERLVAGPSRGHHEDRLEHLLPEERVIARAPRRGRGHEVAVGEVAVAEPGAAGEDARRRPAGAGRSTARSCAPRSR